MPCRRAGACVIQGQYRGWGCGNFRGNVRGVQEFVIARDRLSEWGSVVRRVEPAECKSFPGESCLTKYLPIRGRVPDEQVGQLQRAVVLTAPTMSMGNGVGLSRYEASILAILDLAQRA
jgi:hypothetical protein